jgi:hypothetical protein
MLTKTKALFSIVKNLRAMNVFRVVSTWEEGGVDNIQSPL